MNTLKVKLINANLRPNALLNIYKSFIRPYSGYEEILYGKPNKKSFKNKIEKFGIMLA